MKTTLKRIHRSFNFFEGSFNNFGKGVSDLKACLVIHTTMQEV